MSITAIVEALIDSGASPQMILAAVRADEKSRPISPVKRELSEKQIARIEKRKNGLIYGWEKTRYRIFQRDGRICRYCDDMQGPFHIDHVVPLNKGGTNEEINLAVACADCNLSKSDMLLEEWMATWE